MIDTFTKIVLTVIGIALCALVIQNAVPSATAQFGSGWCGGPGTPCQLQVDVTHTHYRR